jgi:hypothetical protein
MRHRTRAGFLAAAGALTLGSAGSAAASAPQAAFGQHVASCAQEHLGQRAGVPGVTCTHDGTTMTFPTFGAMVEHMRGHHG